MKKLNLTKTAIKNHDELWTNYRSRSTETDPELIEVFDNFAFDDVISYGSIDTKTRVMMILGYHCQPSFERYTTVALHWIPHEFKRNKMFE